MKTALALLLFATTTTPPTVEAIRFAPVEGSAVRKTFEQDLELTQVAHTTVVDGQAQQTEGGQDITQQLRLSLVDEYAGVAEAGVTELRRSFESLAMTSTRSEADSITERPRALEIEMESPLAGRTVAFRASAAGAALTPRIEGEEDGLADDVLAGLVEDTDLRLFLPPSADVAENARWSIDPKGLANVLAPAGDLRFEARATSLPPGAAPPGNPGSSPLDGWVAGDVEGAALATFAGTSTVDGRACAVIQLEIDLSSTRDTTESAREKFAAVPQPAGDETALTLDFSEAVCVLKGEGELVWDLEAGRFRSFTLDARIGLVVDTAATILIGDERRELEIRDEFTGSLRVLQDAHAE